jgi:peptidoglycan/xylan/chitin deacetylase (PgdA/CDA1 family)
VADLVADVLRRHDVRVTFFMANERTLNGGGSLDDAWTNWWRERQAEGHAFGSHSYDHVYWVSDLDEGHFKVRATFGPQAGKIQTWNAKQYCQELDRVAARFTQMTGGNISSLFRAPGGKTSASLLNAARQCGYQHVAWSSAGFLGDELSSERFPNQRLLEQALRNIRSNDILMAHLGIWSRKDPWAPAVLEPLIVGLKQKGFCFRTLDEHPQYGKRVSPAQNN